MPTGAEFFFCNCGRSEQPEMRAKVCADALGGFTESGIQLEVAEK